MRVAIVGGSGTIGSLLVARLAANGDEVRVLSRTAPTMPPESAVAHFSVDLRDGMGLEAGLADVETVVDASNALRRADDVLVAGTRRLVHAGAAAGIAHHVGISIVGCDRVPTAYYRAKVAQEEAIAAGDVPWSLLRATQFHPLIAGLFAAASRCGVLPTGRAVAQPVDPEAVADRLTEIVHAGPVGRAPDIAGPQVLTLGQMAHSWREAEGRKLLPLRLPIVGGALRAIQAGGLCDPAHPGPGRSFEQWLAQR